MKEQITYDVFDKIDIRIGTVISVKKNEKARKPSLVVEVDFGKDIGIKQSSAQITHYYNEENLMNKQIIGVCNFAEKNIAGVVSQVLILGAIDSEGKVVLLHPSQKTEIIGEIVGFNREEKSDACELVSSITGDNSRNVVSFGTEAGLFQEIGISTVVCGPGSIEQAHKIDEFIELNEIKKCIKFLDGLKKKSELN